MDYIGREYLLAQWRTLASGESFQRTKMRGVETHLGITRPLVFLFFETTFAMTEG